MRSMDESSSNTSPPPLSPAATSTLRMVTRSSSRTPLAKRTRNTTTDEEGYREKSSKSKIKGEEQRQESRDGGGVGNDLDANDTKTRKKITSCDAVVAGQRDDSDSCIVSEEVSTGESDEPAATSKRSSTQNLQAASEAIPLNNASHLSKPIRDDPQVISDASPPYASANINNECKMQQGKHPSALSMNLEIHPSDTQRLFDSSRAFNVQLYKLRKKIANTTMTGTTSGKEDLKLDNKRPKQAPPSSNEVTYQSLLSLLLKAAKSIDDPLISALVSKLESSNFHQNSIKTSLLFFLDSDKSTKLQAAFDLLSANSAPPSEEDWGHHRMEAQHTRTQEKDTSTETAPNGSPQKDFSEELAELMISDNTTPEKFMGRSELIQLFHSFLLSINMSVLHAENEKEPNAVLTSATQNKSSTDSLTMDTVMGIDATNDDSQWRGATGTDQDIIKAATFAADDLIKYKSTGMNLAERRPSTTSDEKVVVSFDDFGNWYNNGGYSLVPWLELIDLSKWNHPQNADSDCSLQQSASKRLRPNEPITPAVNISDLLGSPTTLFAQGARVGMPTPPPEPASSPEDTIQSFSAMFGEMNESRTVVSFDFSGSSPSSPPSDPTVGRGSFHINISEENLLMLSSLVRRTGLAQLSPQEVDIAMMKYTRRERQKHGEDLFVISREQFGKFIREIVPKEASKQFDTNETENFSNYFTNFFTCFDYNWSDLKKDEVNAKELMVGFSFLCAGNKSAKLAAAFDILDVANNGYLTQRGLMQYLRSYLTMLAGISLLSSTKKITAQIRKRLLSTRRHDAFLAVQNGAHWTLGHFLRAFEVEIEQEGMKRSNAVTFEDFAKWYTEGGYVVAPWLELLDLNKFLSLIGESSRPSPRHAYDKTIADILFTFPLANNQSLVILREDAKYVCSVVRELGLLSITCEEIWETLYSDVAASLKKRSNAQKSVSMEVDQDTFVECMIRVMKQNARPPKEKSSDGFFSPKEVFKNFFLSFDIEQSNRVALNQLMCGLTLLCGGKKSSKLVFAFGLFDGHDTKEVKNGRKKPSMGREDFVNFFRSFLIVMFSCCNQSLDLSGDAVSQYIADTAQSITKDVMAFQWRTKKLDRVKFENFSEWYNEGGFETAPWLELLDLNKWVLIDHQEQLLDSSVNPNNSPTQAATAQQAVIQTPHQGFRDLITTPKAEGETSKVDGSNCPPASEVDIFDLDMDDVDAVAMDLMLQQEATADTVGHSGILTYGDTESIASPSHSTAQNALKFHLLTSDSHRGYMISIEPSQVNLLKRLVTETGLSQTDASTVCNFILREAKSFQDLNITKDSFHAAMNNVFSHTNRSATSALSKSTELELSEFLDKLFAAFDWTNAGFINALDLACGITVLCGGRKSDKLEHVFEILDEDKDSLLSQQEITRFIRSFLIILTSVSSYFTLLDGNPCGNDKSTICTAIETGSEWATSQVFDSMQQKSATTRICFDDFGEWYTKGGYQSIPWLELLDLRKWVV